MNISNWIAQEYCHALSMTLIHSLWQGLFIVLILHLFVYSRKKKSAEVFYLAHYAGLLLLFFSCLFTYIYYISNQPALGSLAAFTFSEVSVSRTNSNYSGAYSEKPWESWISVFWLAGMFIFLIKSAMTTGKLYRIRTNSRIAGGEWLEMLAQLRIRTGIEKPIRLLSSREICVPMAMGILRPAIIFPTSFFTHLSPDQVESILLHEIGHIRRNDYLFNLIQCFLENIFFFNPASWYLNHQIRKYREYQCDDLVQKHIENKRSYLEALYKVAFYSVNAPKTAPSFIHNKSILLMRVKRMLNTPASEFQFRPLLGFAIAILLLVGTYSFTTKDRPQKANQDLYDVVEEYRNSEFTLRKNLHSSLKALPDLVIPNMNHATLRLDERISEIESIGQNSMSMSMSMSQHKLPGKQLTANASLQYVQDTIKKNQRIKELENQIEQLSGEIEALSEQMSEEIEDRVEAQAIKLEELSERLEEQIGTRMEDMEENALDEEQVRRLEELSRQLEEHVQANMEGFEEQHSEIMDKYEDQMEELSGKMEELYDYEQDTVRNKEELRKLKEQMRELNRQMREELRGIELNHNKIRNDPEFKRIREEMELVQDEIREQVEVIRREHKEVWNDETKAIREEMRAAEREIRENMRSMESGVRDQIRQKAMEIEQLSRELRDEYRKLRQEKGEEGNN